MVGKAVQGNFDGNYARVICRFIQQVNKWFGTVEGKAEKQVVILQIIERTACIPFGKVDRNKGLGFVIKPAFSSLCGSRADGRAKPKEKSSGMD